MLSRIRRSKSNNSSTPPVTSPVEDYEGDDPSINGVGSLLGGEGAGVSLNGESVMLPDDDDMSSIHTETLPESGGKSAFRYIPDDSTLGGVSADGVGNDPPHGEEDVAERSKDPVDGSMLPSWLLNAPQWLKGAIVLSTAFLVGAIVLVAVAAALNERGDNSGGFVNSEDNLVAGVPTLNPVPSPGPTSGAPITAIPTVNPTSSKPTVTGDLGMPSTSPPAITTSSKPSLFPSGGPTDFPSLRPTVRPSVLPTASPTSVPSLAPTPLPTEVPTAVPTLGTYIPTDNPTAGPTTLETLAPVSPTNPDTTVFYLTAHRPQGSVLTDYEDYLPLLPTDADFMVHLGDWNSPFTTGCDEDSYQEVSDLYSTSSVPVYFIVGDNEYNDCPNYPESLQLWYQYNLEFWNKFWPQPSWRVKSDGPNYPENFSFVLRTVLYVGINLVGGEVRDQTEWDARMAADLSWIDGEFQSNAGSVDILVLFMHSDPTLSVNQDFFSGLFDLIPTYNIPTILVHRNLGVESGGFQANYNNISDLVVLVAEGGIWPPMRVEINPVTGSFDFDQSSWFDSAVLGN